jgi:hypothetical protein
MHFNPSNVKQHMAQIYQNAMDTLDTFITTIEELFEDE